MGPFSRNSAVVLALALSSLAVACASPDDADESDTGDSAQTVAGLSYVGTKVVTSLSSDAKLRPLEHRTWEVTTGNSLPQDWLRPTIGSESFGESLASLPTGTTCAPEEPNCDPDFKMRTCDGDTSCPSGTCKPFAPSVTADGQAPKKMCVGYADWYEEAYYKALVSAEEQVDISSLWLPTDRFAPAIRNGLLRLAARGKPITVRILAGDVTALGPFAERSNAAALALLTKGLPSDAPLKIYVAQHSAAFLSWNHSKIIASDGKYSFVGGHNMHTADYQEKDPVSDLSMGLDGPASAAAHRYLNEMWDVACKRGNLHGFGLVSFPDGLPCPSHYNPKPAAAPGSIPVIAAGRLGAVSNNASDAALLAMVDAAKESVVMSQEDILGGRIPKTSLSVAPPPRALLDRLGAAMGRGVDVYLVISNVDGGLFTTSYSHGWTAAETAQQMADHMKSKPELFPAGTDIPKLLCEKMHVAPMRLSNEDRWADGKVFSNHSKLLMIDTQAFYIGSQNAYTSDLAEFGYIIDSAEKTQELRDRLWEPLWRYSQRAAASGSEATSCAIR